MDNFETTAIINIDDEYESDELINTIKMEPILEKVEIKEEETVVQKRKMFRMVDYILIVLIVLVSVAFIYVILKVR